MPSDYKKQSKSRGRRDSRDRGSDKDSKDREEKFTKGFSSKKVETSSYTRKSKFDFSNEER